MGFLSLEKPSFSFKYTFLSAYFLLGAIAFITQFNFKISWGDNVAATATCLPKFGLFFPGYEVVSGKQLPTEAILSSVHWSQWTKAGIKHFSVTNAPNHFLLPSINRWLVNRNPQFGIQQRRKLFSMQNSSAVIHHGCEMTLGQVIQLCSSLFYSALCWPALLCTLLCSAPLCFSKRFFNVSG